MRENICTQCLVNNLARTESFWVFSPGFSSLINNISNIKQSNFDLHFLKTENCLSFKSDFDRPWSSKCLPIAECLCSPMRWCKCRVVLLNQFPAKAFSASIPMVSWAGTLVTQLSPKKLKIKNIKNKF